jgi:DNA topoisomerase I
LASKILVITEKPSSARKIAHALDDSGTPKIAKHGKINFYTSNQGVDELVIVSAVGHIYSIDQIGDGWTYPIFNIRWVPAYTIDKRLQYTKPYLDAIIGLSKNVDSYVSACDFDQEGSLIAYNIIKHGIGEKALNNSKRMIFSTLTSKELKDSWNSLKPSLDYSIIAAGKTRHEADWLFGINLTRALTLATSQFLVYNKVLSIGRVQGPTLKFVYDQENMIQCFVPTPFWRIISETEIEGHVYTLEYEKLRIERESHAKEVVEACKGKIGIVTKIQIEKKYTEPPPPFNLGDLQSEAYRHFKISPTKTLEMAEKLYLEAYISYPRTDSNKISSRINIKEILKNLSKNNNYRKESNELLAEKRYKPKQGKGDDPAHPAIHPTGLTPKKLQPGEAQIYDIIVKRFLASLSNPMIQIKNEITINVNSHTFYLAGIITEEPGWTRLYQPYYKTRDKQLPEIILGQKIQITKLKSRREYTNPPPHYNPLSLTRKMEQQKIGTKSTRSKIIDTLYQRGYIKGKKISITRLGEATIETLEKHCPEIINISLTRHLEKKLELIELGKIEPLEVFNELVETLKPILKKFRENEIKIGNELAEAINEIEKELSSTSCIICPRDKMTNSVFCTLHNEAYKNLEEAFQSWRYALGYNWLDYLEKIKKISGTGETTKQVIKHILARNPP